MRVFQINNTDLYEISETPFSLERVIQRLFENSLPSIFGLDFVESEFELHGLRIDTLAFDKESNSFVIIEYKKERNFSVVDQGMAYLSLLLSNKADFILAYNEKSSSPLKREDVDWTQSRVFFIAPEFTTHQQLAIGFKDFPVELWEVHMYANKLFAINKIEPPQSKESITTIAKHNPAVRRISQEVKVYDEEYHLNKAESKVKELYSALTSGIKNFGADIELRPKKQYVGFWRKQILFTTIKFPKGKLRVKINNMNPSELKDPSKLAKPRKGGGSVIYLTASDQIPFVVTLIKQAYNHS